VALEKLRVAGYDGGVPLRLAKLCMILVVLLVSPRVLFATGGTCPSGANYLSLSNPTGPRVALSSFGVTSCYYIAANGSDSNNGTSESTPWLHSPGMPNCLASCASVTPASGEGFIFRGGDTWHFGNSSASPYTGGGFMEYAWNGTASNYIYFGVDPSWYSGVSWARPIFTADNPTSTSAVASCTYSIAAGPLQYAQAQTLVLLAGTYEIFDNFELTGLCWSTNAFGTYLYFSAATGHTNVAYVENNYVHGWTHTAAGGQAGGTGIADQQQNDGETIRFNVIDGSDSDPLSLRAWGIGSGGRDLEYNVTTNLGGSSILDQCKNIHDNLFQYQNQLNDGSGHSDVLFCLGEASDGASSPNIFYNNRFRLVGSPGNGYAGYVFVPGQGSDYEFNNVYDNNNASYGNYLVTCDQGTCGAKVMWNNTGEANLPGVSGLWSIGATTITAVNNHWITSDPSAFSVPSEVTETAPVYQTLSTANSQGYSAANDFTPISSSAATVTANGTNETTGYCADSVLHNAAAEAACKQGITGVSYNQANHTVVYPAFAPTPRPATGAWNVGAYQFGGSNSNTVNQPTNLTATVQ